MYARRRFRLVSDNPGVQHPGAVLGHGRIYRFENDGSPEIYNVSADWMRRNIENRMETIVPITDVSIRAELDGIMDVYEADNCSTWDMQVYGT